MSRRGIRSLRQRTQPASCGAGEQQEEICYAGTLEEEAQRMRVNVSRRDALLILYIACCLLSIAINKRHAPVAAEVELLPSHDARQAEERGVVVADEEADEEHLAEGPEQEAHAFALYQARKAEEIRNKAMILARQQEKKTAPTNATTTKIQQMEQAEKLVSVSEPEVPSEIQAQAPTAKPAAKHAPASNEAMITDAMAKFGFNEVKSLGISPNRTVPDVRSSECRALTYNISALPAVTVVVTFVNEPMSTLLRTIWSIYNRTPASLLSGIVLVDDGSSEWAAMGPALQQAINTKWDGKVTLVRSEKRIGAVRARMMGVQAASGPVIAFMDSHVEVNVKWYEPLAEEIRKNPSLFVLPSIDVIDATTMEYSTRLNSYPSIGSMTWGIDFQWLTPKIAPGQDKSLPMDSPIIPGGLFAVRKAAFLDLGAYDIHYDGLSIENLELSLRAWMCGSRIIVHPCSRIGHVFKTHRPVSSVTNGMEGSIFRNSARVAEVWLGDYKKYFYKIHPGAKDVEIGSTEEIHAIIANHKCKDFSWYLTNVLPDLFIPDGSNVLLEGMLKGQNSRCVDKMNKGAGGKAGVYTCHGHGANQQWMYTKEGEIRTLDGLCLDVTAINSEISMLECVNKKSSQLWTYDTTTQIFKHVQLRACLDISTDKSLRVKTCTDAANQKWVWAK